VRSDERVSGVGVFVRVVAQDVVFHQATDQFIDLRGFGNLEGLKERNLWQTL